MRVDEHNSIAATPAAGKGAGPNAVPNPGPVPKQTAEPTSDSALQRWSRRKLASTATTEPSAPTVQQPQHQQPAEAASSSAADREAATADCATDLSELELPDIDSLGEDSDYSAFLSPEVEASVRRVALRKLFGLPCFAVRDGLDDYDDDFGSFEGLGDIVTHEMKRLAAQELARQQQDDGELGELPADGQAEQLATETPVDDAAPATRFSTDDTESAADPQPSQQLASDTTSNHQGPTTHA